MKEDFLHYLWKYHLYSKPLAISSGENIEIISAGEQNYDAGPDFLNARIKIDETIWAGNVEIHVKASDWYRHNHQNNKDYDNIILHVVAANDKPIKRQNGQIIPTIELTIPENIYKQYLFLMQNTAWVPCESFINSVDEFTILQWKEALLVERLSDKSDNIAQRFSLNNSNWEETFYQSLAYNFGFKTNALPFEMLAKSIPLLLLGKHKDQLLLIEAMLFGQAGLLSENSNDTYVNQLIKDYRHLSVKFSLDPLSGHLWKFMRLRPANFPTIRLAQFSALIHKSSVLFSKLLETEKLSDVYKLFDIKASKYWDTHYTFEKESHSQVKRLGSEAFNNIVINTIAPVLFYYGQQKGEPKYIDRVLSWLLETKGENNQIIRKWGDLGVEAKNAFDSQALIQLKNVYCKNRKCLNCRIGNKVMKHTF